MEQSRPTITEYSSLPEYISDMLFWRKQSDSNFSIRKATQKIEQCSPSLVTQVAKGNRSLTSERVKPFAKLLSLTKEERIHLEKWANVYKQRIPSDHNEDSSLKLREQNNFLSDWVNVFVKDSIRLKDFQATGPVIANLLGNIASAPRVEKAIKFLFREGHWRKDLNGNIIKNDHLTKSTNNVSDRRIKQFHKASLDIARRGLDHYDVNDRVAKAMVLPVNQENVEELRDIIHEYQGKLEEFSTKYQDDNERLYQVITHLTPIGGNSHVH